MKTNFLLSIFLATGVPVMAQNVVKVGKGSYAAYTPLNLCYSEDHKSDDWGFKGDKSRDMQVRKIYLTERENQPIPTNDWWTNLITEQYSGNLWSYPQMVKAVSTGLEIHRPSFWIDDGTELKSNTVLSVTGDNFKPVSAVAEHWHDWDVEFLMKDGDKEMYVTMAHGIPFTWIESKGFDLNLQLQKSGLTDTDYQDTNTRYLDAQGKEIRGDYQGCQLIMERGGDLYGIYLPAGSVVSVSDKGAHVQLKNQAKGYVVVAMQHQLPDLLAMAPYALNVPRDTRVNWKYDGKGTMKTIWHVETENLDGKANNQEVLQGFIPHQYRDTGCPVTLPFNGMDYRTPHGLLKMAKGNDFEVDYKFYGMLPYWAVPDASDSDKNPYDEAKMMQMLTRYADTGTFGTDTYWGGKGLTQMALYMMMAREMGKKDVFDQCRKRLKKAMVNWLTYTPGEKNTFFARYDRWGAMVGYGTSYDSDTFNDHHFHYGYFTLAGALLAMVDDDFRDNYGEMLRLVAKDYANWDRKDLKFPLFRTFDPWAGHSFAGGMGDGNGNGQESTSEAMQSWGGLYMLGVALGDDEMRDAGIFGWLSEARGTAEYWFDRHRDNIDYEKFKHPYNSNLTCHGVGYWTYFGYQNIYMQGIQWMPTSTALDYLSEDKPFAKWDYEMLFQDPSKTDDRDASNGKWFDESFSNPNADRLDKSGDWGNVTLSYLQRSDPEEAARLFDLLWQKDNDIAKTSSTNGISYFSTHSHLTHGDLDWSITASIPTARVYKKEDGTKTHMAYNPTDKEITVSFSDGFSMQAAPRQLTIEGKKSKAITDIITEAEQVDIRESLLMPNLALHKPCTESGHENVGTVPENATDGDNNTRWGSRHKDGEWIQVDLQQVASIYKVRIHWEAAYASEYTVALSEDGEHWVYQQDVSSTGGWNDVLMGDHKARYVRITGNKRSTDYGISLYELQVFGASSDAAKDAIQGIQIHADADVLKQHQEAQLTILGYTNDRRWVDVKEATFSSTDGEVSLDGVFIPSEYGEAKVKVMLPGNGTVYEKIFPVEETLYPRYISVNPTEVKMISDGTPAKVKVNLTDQFKAPIQVTDGSVSYRILQGDVKADKEGDVKDDKNVNASIGQEVDASIAQYDDETSELNVYHPGIYSFVVDAGKSPLGVSIADTILVKATLFTDMNLAYQKPAYATSQNGDGSGAEKAVDGDAIGSRWESAWNNAEEALWVDLVNNYLINKVVVYWENARAKKYELQISLDGKEWTTIKTMTDTKVGGETIEFSPVEARYIKIHGLQKELEAYGYSIYELEVYGLKQISTGIGYTKDNCSPNLQDNQSVYDLKGCKVSNGTTILLRPGVYVKNGKKIVIK